MQLRAWSHHFQATFAIAALQRSVTIVPIDLPRPRDMDAPGYLEARDRIFAAMGELRLARGEG